MKTKWTTASCDAAPKGAVARMRGNSIKDVVTRMD